MTSLCLPWPPTANRYWRFVTLGKRSAVLLSREARLYKARVAAYAPTVQRVEGPLRVSLRFFRPRKAGDLDGALKPLLDALQGVLYTNDAQIVELHAYRFDDKSNPRVEVEVEPA